MDLPILVGFELAAVDGSGMVAVAISVALFSPNVSEILAIVSIAGQPIPTVRCNGDPMVHGRFSPHWRYRFRFWECGSGWNSCISSFES